MHHLTKGENKNQQLLFKNRNDIEAGTTKSDVICLFIHFIVCQFFLTSIK